MLMWVLSGIAMAMALTSADKLETTRLPPAPPARPSPRPVLLPPSPPPVRTERMPPPSVTDRSRRATPRGYPGSWVTTNDYPAQALRLALEGRALTALTVAPSGRLASCAIVESTGSRSLDHATCSNLLRRARYLPALDTAGEPIVATMALGITWRLPSDDDEDAVEPVADPREIAFTNPATPARPLNDLPMLASAVDYPSSLPPLVAGNGVTSVLLRLRVDAAGRLTACAAGDSFAAAELVTVACGALRDGARFVAGSDADGHPAESELFTNARWGVAVLAPVPVPTPGG